jgi:hypothetical protein
VQQEGQGRQGGKAGDRVLLRAQQRLDCGHGQAAAAAGACREGPSESADAARPSRYAAQRLYCSLHAGRLQRKTRQCPAVKADRVTPRVGRGAVASGARGAKNERPGAGRGAL